MTLTEWLAQHPGGKTWLHRKTGLAYTTIHYAANGKHRPRLETARAISHATGGEVSTASIMGLDDTERAA